MLDALGADWTVQSALEPEPFLHPGRAATIVVGRRARSAGSARFIPQVAAGWDWSDPLTGFELDLDAVAARLNGWIPQYRDVTSFPEVREDLAVIVAEAVSAAEVLEVVREAGGPLLREAAVFDVYRGEQAGEGNVSLALRLTYRAPDRTLTDEEVAARRRKISAVARQPRWTGGSVTPSVAVFGAAGYAGALSARLLDRHPAFELRTVTSRSDVGRRLDELYPHHRVPLELEELDLDRHGDVDAAIVAYPHGAAAELVADLHRARRQGRRPERRLPAARRRRVRGVVPRPTPSPELLRSAVYGLPERYREQIAEAQIVANPGCYPTATVLALAPLARAGAIGDVVIDAKSGVSGAGRAATDKTHFVTVDENVNPYGVPRHRHTPEIEQELAALGAELRITFTAHLLPLDQGELVSCYVTPPSGGPSIDARAIYLEAYADEPFVELSDAPPGVRDVRETNICRISVHRDERTGRVIVFARDRQPLEGRRLAGGAEPQPDVRPARGRGHHVSSFFTQPLDRAAGAGNRARLGTGAPGRLPRRRGRGRDQARAARPTSGCSSATRPSRPAPRASRARALRPRRCCCATSAASSGWLRAVVVNSGNANAATGRPGLRRTRPRCRARARSRPACPSGRWRSPRPA